MGQIRVNFKSDFKLRLKSEASWAVPFRVVFFTSNYSEGHVAWYDGKEYHGCRVDEDGVLVVGFDNPSLGLGPLKMEVTYYESDKDFADGVNATVVAPMAVVDDEGNSYVITAGGLSGVDVVATLPTPGPRGEKGDKGDKGDTFVYDDLSEEDKDDIARRAGADVLAVNEAAREKAEEEREKAESGRVKAENARVSAENARVTAESGRVSAESSRAAAESARVTAESGRVSAENARKTAESSRAAAENARVTAESARVTAENARKDAEVLREVAEVKRAAAEAGRAEELASKADKTEVEKIEKKVEALMSLHELEELAFYIDINTASEKNSTRVDVGGNLMMRSMWENAKKPILMDRDGNYIELNPNDCRYTAEGEYLLKENGTIIDKYSHCDMMELIPEYYGYVQTVTVGETTKLLPWFSLVPLPGGYVIPQQVVGKFKSGNVGSEMRSLPGLTPDNTKTINAFWNLAQARSKNHGLANLDFRNYMLFHVMSKYGYRDVQNAVGADGTKVFGVGLDGTESKGSDKFTDQRYIKTGSTLTLGDNDGNVPVTDNNGDTVHSVSVCGFENPYGQYWEMVQGLCSVGTDVYHWRGNVMPTGTPTAETFAKIDHTLLMRPTTAVWGMNLIASEEGQGVYMIPKESVSGISYGDYFSYSKTGQLWLFGGSSYNGASCGLASAASNTAWSYSSAYISARLAFYGSVNKVSPTRLAELKA